MSIGKMWDRFLMWCEAKVIGVPTKVLEDGHGNDGLVTVTCKVCGKSQRYTRILAQEIAKVNAGYIPCGECGSHATYWDEQALNGEARAK